jgi:hypothetical protein
MWRRRVRAAPAGVGLGAAGGEVQRRPVNARGEYAFATHFTSTFRDAPTLRAGCNAGTT